MFMWTRRYRYLSDSDLISFRYTPRSKIAGSYSISIFNFWGNFILFYIVKVQAAQSCPTLWPHGLYSLWNSPGQNTRTGSLSLLQGIFSTQGSNPGLLHCRQILYQLSHKGSPRILEWITYSFSVDIPDPGIELGSPALQADSFTL